MPFFFLRAALQQFMSNTSRIWFGAGVLFFSRIRQGEGPPTGSPQGGVAPTQSPQGRRIQRFRDVFWGVPGSSAEA